MHFSTKSCVLFAIVGSLFIFTPAMADAAKPAKATKATQSQAKKTFTEDEFLSSISGKSRKVVAEKLGQPERKEQGVKPSGADAAMAQLSKAPEATQKTPVNVEMWYYSNLVRYDSKNTYHQTELTFVNGQVRNITFFNNTKR